METVEMPAASILRWISPTDRLQSPQAGVRSTMSGRSAWIRCRSAGRTSVSSVAT